MCVKSGSITIYNFRNKAITLFSTVKAFDPSLKLLEKIGVARIAVGIDEKPVKKWKVCKYSS